MANQPITRIWLSGVDGDFRGRLEAALTRAGMPPEGLPCAVLAVDEMRANIVEHGYGNDSGHIDVAVWAPGDDILRVALLDRSPHTEWFHRPYPSLEDQARRLAYRGRGRAIAEELSRRLIHRRRPGGGNILVLEFAADAQPNRGDLPTMSQQLNHLVSMTRITYVRGTPVCCTNFRGAVREGTVFRFREYLEQGGKRSPFLLVDLSEVGYLSSTGLGLLVDQARCQQREGGWLRLVNPSSTVRMIISVAGLENVLSPVDSLEAGTADLTQAA